MFPFINIVNFAKRLFLFLKLISNINFCYITLTLKPVSAAMFVFLIQAEGLMVTDGLTNIISQYFFLHKKSQKLFFVCLFAIGENWNAKIVFVAVFNPHFGSLPNYDNFCIKAP